MPYLDNAGSSLCLTVWFVCRPLLQLLQYNSTQRHPAHYTASSAVMMLTGSWITSHAILGVTGVASECRSSLKPTQQAGDWDSHVGVTAWWRHRWGFYEWSWCDDDSASGGVWVWTTCTTPPPSPGWRVQ